MKFWAQLIKMIYQYWKIYRNTCTWIQVLLHSPNQKYIKVLLEIWTLSPCLKFELKWYIYICVYCKHFFQPIWSKVGVRIIHRNKILSHFFRECFWILPENADIACYASWMSVKKKPNLSEIPYSEFNFHVLEYLSTQTTVSGIKQVLGSVFPIM